MSERNIILPLHQFDVGTSTALDLTDARIIPIDRHPLQPMIESETGETAKYALKMKRVEREKPRRSLDRVLIIFKLFKGGLVLSKPIYDDDPKVIDELPHYIHYRSDDGRRPEYSLSVEEQESFTHFWSGMNSSE